MTSSTFPGRFKPTIDNLNGPIRYIEREILSKGLSAGQLISFSFSLSASSMANTLYRPFGNLIENVVSNFFLKRAVIISNLLIFANISIIMASVWNPGSIDFSCILSKTAIALSHCLSSRRVSSVISYSSSETNNSLLCIVDKSFNRASHCLSLMYSSASVSYMGGDSASPSFCARRISCIAFFHFGNVGVALCLSTVKLNACEYRATRSTTPGMFEIASGASKGS
mmetsp:Transcript_1298/g.1848  ORF Transcript_1298/g.1848 Transcript_1298/m.1848 type:complete len:226 (+) Transcript_1298:549-1226(+)